MYNYDYKVTYNDIQDDILNKIYKKDILSCFYLENPNYDTINQVQEQLFEKYKDSQIFNNLMNYIQKNQTFIPSKLPLKTCFVLCFSFDYFYIFHLCLVDLYNTNTISDLNYNNMIHLIKKNN
jgi:hypothetical protein